MKKDIDRFKKKSKMPFYDTDYVYTPGDDLKVAEYEKLGAVPFFDPLEDAKTKEAIDRAVERWTKWYYGYGGPWISDPAFMAADGFHGPIVSNGNAWVFWRLNNTPCAFTSRDQWKSNNFFPTPCPGTADNSQFAQPFCTNTVNSNPGTAQAVWVCPADASVWAADVAAGDTHTIPGRFRTVEFWTIDSVARPASFPARPVGEILLEPGVGTPIKPFPVTPPMWPDPWREVVAPPGTQPDVETQPKPKKKGLEVPISFSHPLTMVRGGAVPMSPPDTVIVTNPGGGVDVIITPPSHPVDGGVSPGEHPKKPHPKLPAAFQGAKVFVNFVTEAIDFLDALHQAIPRHLRGSSPNGPTPAEKLEEIFDNWEDVNVGDALENFLNNQIEDHLYGKLGKLQQKGARKTNRLFGQVFSRAGELGDVLNPSLPVPEVHVDEDGNIEVTIGEVALIGG